MSTAELIRAEMETLREDDLHDLYQIVREFSAARARARSNGSALSRLRQIKIDGPEDFAANLDLYLNGEKSLGAPPNSD